MTSVPYNTGFGENMKPSSKVLKPPGGGSSDIFGSETQQTPRAVRNHMASNIFGAGQNSVKNNGGDSVRRAQKNIDSYSRLFGEPERPFTPAKNHMKSNIPIGPNAAGDVPSKEMNGLSSSNNIAAPTTTTSSSSSSLATNGHAARNGNKFENGDHQNGVTKTVYRKVMKEVNIPRYNGTSSYEIDKKVMTNGQCNDFRSSRMVAMSNGNLKKIPQQSKIIIPNGNGNGIIYGVGGGGGGGGRGGRGSHNGNNNENESSGSTTTSSMISPASTTTTASSASKFGSPKYMSRNPVTGFGIEEPIQKPRRTVRRDGNPVTGEGYKSAGVEINTSVPALNGANQVIIKNRIPPGGYSSGLW